ncbi:MAG: hypothetical protein A3E01_18815 [Gammaproteobacteria bacterium RIFCSPHIGHO2_12_FULL_63_22]|nr:MAG: hypothetical protein A3E01_18815 [Gammaproteobacteria bacterium RIFCSPHIGHO2_12_FULL_63_22]
MSRRRHDTVPAAWPRPLAILSFVAATLIAPPLAAQTMALARVPVDCEGKPSCGDDPKLRAVLKRHKAVMLAGTPLEANINLNRCDAMRADTPDWGPADAVAGGHAAIEQLKAEARLGVPTDGTLTVETTASSTKERHLARCSVTQIGEAFGPPRDCVTMAILTRDKDWVRGSEPPPPPEPGDEDFLMCPTAGHFRQGGAIQIDYDVKSPGPLLPMAKAIQRALETKLGLSVEMEQERNADYVSLVAASGMHNSKVLATGWREIMDFDVFLESDEDTQVVSVSGRSHLLVCRQAVSDMSSYHGLSDAQRAIYLRYLDTLVAESIATICPRFRRIDDKTLSCH